MLTCALAEPIRLISIQNMSKLNLDSIDAFLSELESAVDDDQLRTMFSSYSAIYEMDLPSDPFGEDYRDKQFSIYEFLSGLKYNSKNEKTEFDVVKSAISPFPYCHGSCATVGGQLMAIGYLIQNLDLKKGAKIIEFGPGWGNTSIALAKMGFNITVVDVEKNFCDLIAQRAMLEKLNINIINSDFDYIMHVEEKFDAIVYFECFHHAPNHLELMENFDRVLNENGKVIFGAEPILKDFPVPWGVRMDGESLWAIRKNGWLELGFNQDYFTIALQRYGWSAEYHRGADGPWSSVAIAKRLSELNYEFKFGNGQIQTEVGQLTESGSLVTTAREGYLAFGPYITLPFGEYRCEYDIVGTQSEGYCFIEVVANGGNVIIAREKLVLSDALECIGINFYLQSRTEQLEMRIYITKCSYLEIGRLRIVTRAVLDEVSRTESYLMTDNFV